MTESIIAAVITGGLSLLGILIANNKNSAAMDAKLDKQQAVTATKLDELTREVRKHNNFAERIPALEAQIRIIHDRLAVLEKGA